MQTKFLYSFIDKFIGNVTTINKVSDLYNGLIDNKVEKKKDVEKEKDIAKLASSATSFQYGTSEIDRDENALLFRSQQFNDYLVAIDFCNNLKDSKYSVQIFDRQKNYFVQEMLIEKHFEELVDILGDINGDIKNKIQSCYLLRGLKNRTEAVNIKNSAIEVLKNEYKNVKIELRKYDAMEKNVYLCCIVITLATLNNESYLEKYIVSLIKNFKKAEVNRRFHLNYYGDSDNVHITTQLSDNLDDVEVNNTKLNAVNKYRYYYSYQHFYARIEKYIPKSDSQRMFQLDMFTFLNILQVRMQYHMKKILLGAYKIPEKFIFDIECAYALLREYTKKCDSEAKTTTPLDKMLAAYIKMIRHDFTEFLALTKKGATDDKTALPTSLYQKNMFELFRNNMSSDSNRKQGQETLAVHALSSYYIGFQYLPYRDEKREDYYDKNAVLRVLLFRDICEAIVCGSDPNLNDDQCKEMSNDIALRICCLGTYEGFEDFSQDLTVLYDLINGDNSTVNYSAQVISEIDKVYSLYELFYFNQYENATNKIGSLYLGIKTDVCKQILNKITINGKTLQALIDRVTPSIRNINKW